MAQRQKNAMKINAPRSKLTRMVVSLAASLLVSVPIAVQAQEKSFTDMADKFVRIPAAAPDSEMLAKATVAVNYIKRMELPQASRAINEALQLDAHNSYLHFFNGFVYHLMARQGDTQKTELAIEGYQQAVRLDPGNYIAQEFLGLAHTDLKQFVQAKEHFSEALLLAPESTTSLYGLMVASYMTADPATACAMADQFRRYTTAPRAAFLRSSVAVYGSCGEFAKAGQMRDALGALSHDAAEVDGADRRLSQWKLLYGAAAPGAALEQVGGMTRTSLAVPAVAPVTPTPGMPAPVVVSATPAGPRTIPRMVLVDVVLVSTQEQVTTAKGINLLNTLTLQLGSPTGPAYSRNFNESLTAGVSAATTTITRALTVPALAYSLNIANAANTQDEVLARPTLAAIEGMPSEFFSGINLNAAVISTSARR
jgi:tetratricopeptide (TPR) repeat protein